MADSYRPRTAVIYRRWVAAGARIQYGYCAVEPAIDTHKLIPWMRWELTCTGVEDGGNKEGKVDPSTHYTVVFNTFVMCQLFNFINARATNPCPAHPNH